MLSFNRYYPFHYSPYVSDLVNIETFDLKMEKAKPFRPFEQLLAVLPSYSKKLLPEAFQVRYPSLKIVHFNFDFGDRGPKESPNI